MAQSIVVVGSLNIDMVVRTQRHPQPGETLLGSNFQTFPGGKGANQAVAAARAGGTVRLVGRIGADAFGDALLNGLQADRIDTKFVTKTPDAASGVALITLDAQGQNTIVVASGANALLSPQDIAAAEAAFQDAGVLVIQLETPLETVDAALKMARRHGAQVILNPAPARALSEHLLRQVDYLIPNEHELALLSGIDAIPIAADAVSTFIQKAVVVTLGANGVLVVTPHQRRHLAAHRVEVIDTVAAGDAFVGAFATALSEGKDVADAALFGNAAGAIAVTRSGAQPSLPMREEIEAFLLSR